MATIKLPYLNVDAVQRGLENISGAVRYQNEAELAHNSRLDQIAAITNRAQRETEQAKADQLLQEGVDKKLVEFAQDPNQQQNFSTRFDTNAIVKEAAAPITDPNHREQFVANATKTLEAKRTELQLKYEGIKLGQQNLATQDAVDRSNTPEQLNAAFLPTMDQKGNITGFGQSVINLYGSGQKALEAWNALNDNRAASKFNQKVTGILDNPKTTAVDKKAALESIKLEDLLKGYRISNETNDKIQNELADLKSKAFTAASDELTNQASITIQQRASDPLGSAQFSIAGQSYQSTKKAISALAAEKDNKFTDLTVEDRGRLVSSLLTLQAKETALTQGVISATEKAQLSRQENAARALFDGLSPINKQAWINANSNNEAYSPAFIDQLRKDVGKASTLDPAYQSIIKSVTDKFKDDPERLAAFKDYYDSVANTQAAKGSNPQDVLQHLTNFAASLSKENIGAAVSALAGAGTDTSKLEKDPVWLANVSTAAEAGELPAIGGFKATLDATIRKAIPELARSYGVTSFSNEVKIVLGKGLFIKSKDGNVDYKIVKNADGSAGIMASRGGGDWVAVPKANGAVANLTSQQQFNADKIAQDNLKAQKGVVEPTTQSRVDGLKAEATRLADAFRKIDSDSKATKAQKDKAYNDWQAALDALRQEQNKREKQ